MGQSSTSSPVARYVLKTKRLDDSTKQFINILVDDNAPTSSDISAVVDTMGNMIDAKQYNPNKFDLKELQQISAAIQTMRSGRDQDKDKTDINRSLVCYISNMMEVIYNSILC